MKRAALSVDDSVGESESQSHSLLEGTQVILYVEQSVCVRRKMSERLHIEWLITLTEEWKTGIQRTGINWGRSKEELFISFICLLCFYTETSNSLFVYFIKYGRINVLKFSCYVCIVILELLAFVVIFGSISFESAGHSGGKRGQNRDEVREKQSAEWEPSIFGGKDMMKNNEVKVLPL